MPEASDTLLKILETVMHSHTQIAEALIRLEERQQEHNLALAQAIGENSRILAQMLERVIETTTRTEQMTARILTEISARGASH